MISASDSAAAACKPPEVFLSWALCRCQWVVSILLTLLFENKMDLAFQWWTEFIWSYLHGIILLGESFISQCYICVSCLFPSIAALFLFLFPSHCKTLEVNHGPQGTSVFSLPAIFLHILPAVLYTSVFPLFSTLFPFLHLDTLSTWRLLLPKHLGGPH